MGALSFCGLRGIGIRPRARNNHARFYLREPLRLNWRGGHDYQSAEQWHIKRPGTTEEMDAYLENYIPIRLARALRRKLERNPPYWTMAGMDGVPFVVAVQDFHLPGSMRGIIHAATEYVFDVRHSIENGKQKIGRIVEHVWRKRKEKSGFFLLPGTENISAVIVNPQGTLNKFNRMGFIAGFGDRNIRIMRRGLMRGEHDRSDPRPKYFAQDVSKPGYSESWVEGMVVLHNPNARITLPPPLIDGACREFLQEDGRTMSLLPDFHPHFSETVLSRPVRELTRGGTS